MVSYFNDIERFQNRYEKLTKNAIPSAKDLHIEKCQKCGRCCIWRPGSLCVSDISNIAHYLKISIEKLCKEYLVVDEIEDTITVVPIRTTQTDLAGKYVPDWRSFDCDPCIFLDTKKDGATECKIHKVKPEGCRKYKSCYGGCSYVSKWSKKELKKYFGFDSFPTGNPIDLRYYENK